MKEIEGMRELLYEAELEDTIKRIENKLYKDKNE